jgi:hypothetical protein
MSTPQVTSGALLQCSFGGAPAPLMVLPVNRVTAGGMPAATILDNKPMVNIPTFGMCSSPSNPLVIAATAAALEGPTPGPCMPVIETPWTPGAPTVTVSNVPALDMSCQVMCQWAGLITVQTPGQTSVTVL